MVGAGFSAGLGYPQTRSLLIDVWPRLHLRSRRKLSKIIAFHHPEFDEIRGTTFPNMEQLLTEIQVNLDLFDASRPTEGNFKRADLEKAREDLLSEIGAWFHQLYERAQKTPWLSGFVKRLQGENAAIIPCNWDLVLDQKLFARGINTKSYGLAGSVGKGPVLLKPHGSLNWYESTQMQKVSAATHVQIFSDIDPDECIEAFVHPRYIMSKVGRRYTPLIIPPTFLKDFGRPIFRTLWRRCTGILSDTAHVVFLGYSLPAADLQAQFIFRCGFHNQLEGRLKEDGSGDRYKKTGPARVTVVNPDQDAARRIEAVAGPSVSCVWIPKRIQDWVEEG
ncbi:MAG TPA: hypothetical protein VNO32_15420 [Candidatus Acidoferrum sp.]|nr:hypothetical protein [Candidatus Acidoferrum sp.]